MVQTENHACEICESEDLIPISTKGRDYLATHTAICKNCGFVFLSPRMNKGAYDRFYLEDYDKYYRTSNLGLDISDEEMKKNPYGFQPVIERLNALGFEPENAKVLAIGSGDGSNLAFLGRSYGVSDLYAIEPSVKGRQSSEAKGITTVAMDVMEDWEKSHQGAMDLVILRHVLEHLTDINTSLQKIRTSLKKSGLLYIAVPNSYNVGKMTLLRDFFRIVHLSYFSKLSLSNVLHKNGYEVLDIQEHNASNSELFVIARPIDQAKRVEIKPDEYQRQLSYFAPIIEKESKFIERLKALRTFINRRYVILKSSILHR